MWHIGIDLHRKTVVMAAVHDSGEVVDCVTIGCHDTASIVQFVLNLKPFRAVIEASGTYRWLFDLLGSHGQVLLAHPLRLRAMIQRRSKTDKLDAQLLANLLRINQIPLAYIPSEQCQQLRDLTRYRSRLTWGQSEVKIGLRLLLARHNQEAPYRVPFGPRGAAWFRKQDFGPIDDFVRDELLSRLAHYRSQLAAIDEHLQQMRGRFPEIDALLDIHGIALYSALVIVAELGDVERFSNARQVGAYAGLTPRVHQSGGHCYHGNITRQGSRWLRSILVEAGMKAVRKDVALRNFYTRIRKRSGVKIARVAVARKLGEICWKRLRRWHREHRNIAA